jgi:uncharacterized membrane protein
VKSFDHVFGRGDGTTRIEAFSDGVFAIVITLLVLNLQVPDLAPDAPPLDIAQFLRDEMPKLRAYVLSFLVVGLFWANHQRMFNHIARYDAALVWLNLLLLLCVSFIPFPTSLIGRYSGPDAVRLYAANLMFASLAQMTVWAYASGGRRLVGPEVSPSLARYGMLRGAITSVIFAGSLVVSYWDAELAILSWALIPVAFVLLARTHPILQAEDEEQPPPRG